MSDGSAAMHATFGALQVTFVVSQITFGAMQMTFGVMQMTFGMMQMTFGVLQITFLALQITKTDLLCKTRRHLARNGVNSSCEQHDVAAGGSDMKLTEVRLFEMMGRVGDFGVVRTDEFPATSRGGELFAVVIAEVNRARDYGVAR